MDVYILIRRCDQSDFTDHYGDEATDSKEIVGVFMDYDTACISKENEETQDRKMAQELGCDMSLFEIETHSVIERHAE